MNDSGARSWTLGYNVRQTSVYSSFIVSAKQLFSLHKNFVFFIFALYCTIVQQSLSLCINFILSNLVGQSLFLSSLLQTPIKCTNNIQNIGQISISTYLSMVDIKTSAKCRYKNNVLITKSQNKNVQYLLVKLTCSQIK